MPKHLPNCGNNVVYQINVGDYKSNEGKLGLPVEETSLEEYPVEEVPLKEAFAN